MTGSSRYRVNAPSVIHEAVDGEVIVINLDTGSYYSLRGSAALIWELLDSGQPAKRVVAQLSPLLAERGDDAIDGFISKLRAEELLVPDTVHQPPPDEALLATALERRADAGAALQLPELVKYTDMQAMLLLDPIHDVDDSGWPSAKADGPSGN